MDRNAAKDKIEKLLRLANNSGATKAESENALEMAKKLADKYGFKISAGATEKQCDKPSAERKESNKYKFVVKNMDKKIVTFILDTIGIHAFYFTGNELHVVTSKEFNPVAFCAYYKQMYSFYKKLRNNHKEISYNFFFNMFKAYFIKGYNAIDVAASDLCKSFILMGAALKHNVSNIVH